MESSDSGEPEKKRHHADSGSSPVKAQNLHTSSSSNKSVHAAALQYQNQKLVQQLDVQKHKFNDLEAKVNNLREKESAYNDALIMVNQLWNQLVDDLILLGVRAGAGQSALQTLDNKDLSRGSIPSCPAEDVFLCRLLEVDCIGKSGDVDQIKCIEEALAQRHSATCALVKSLEDTICAQRVRISNIAQALQGALSTEDATIQLARIDDLFKEEAKNLRDVIDVLLVKHTKYADDIHFYIKSNLVDQSEIKSLAGELEEMMEDLEKNSRKLIELKMQRGLHVPTTDGVNGSSSPEKCADRTTDLRELKASIEETKMLAADRLSELEEAKEDNLKLSKQLQDLQNELKDDKYLYSSRLYILLHDQLQHWKNEADRYKTLTDLLQADRSTIVQRGKDVAAKLESIDAAQISNGNPGLRIGELERQLQNCIIEKNDIELRMEEAVQDSRRKDIKEEFHVMASALSKEMGMMEGQLSRWKETAHQALSLCEEAQSLRALLERKTNEQKRLAQKCTEQMAEVKSLEELVDNLEKEKLKLQIFLDLYGQQTYDSRDLLEINESERRACSQAEILGNALAEHSLELRVKAANEAEAACQQRLSVAETEIEDLRAKVDASERDVSVLEEEIKIKDAEAESYISEIETIGQAYEDMQTQNQRLLQQVTERDEYNIKLVSESVKTKQAHSSLLSDTQSLTKQLQKINESLELNKERISHSEEQMKICLTDALKHVQEDRHFAVSLETTKWELTDAEKELKCLKSVIASSEKEYEQIKHKKDEIQVELEAEINEKKRLQEELEDMNKQIAEISSETAEAIIHRLQDEIKDCKSILKCGVCFDRPKEVVIVKCYHMFCNPCIQRNLEIRHRKCPGCGTPFGQNDVRLVKI